MRLSVIIPTYNCENYLEECLHSVIDQLPEDGELIVVDDGSEDGTRRVLSRYENMCPRLRIFYAEHKGASGARNTGLEKARGDYVSFLDCDDRMYPGFPARSLPLLLGNADLYIFGFEHVDPDGKREAQVLPACEYNSTSDFADAYIRSGRMLIYSACNKFYSRELLEKNRLRFEEGTHFGEDRLFNYAFLTALDKEKQQKIVTAEPLMFEYVKRRKDSMSNAALPPYEEYLRLQEEKIRCFCTLSRNTTEEEKAVFRRKNLDAVRELFAER